MKRGCSVYSSPKIFVFLIVEDKSSLPTLVVTGWWTRKPSEEGDSDPFSGPGRRGNDTGDGTSFGFFLKKTQSVRGKQGGVEDPGGDIG